MSCGHTGERTAAVGVLGNADSPLRSLLPDKPGEGGQLWGGQKVAAQSEEEVWCFPVVPGHEGAGG